MAQQDKAADPRKGKLMVPVVDLYIDELVRRSDRRTSPGTKSSVQRSGRAPILRNLAIAWDAQRPARWFKSLDEAWLEDYFLDNLDHITGNTRRVYASWVRSFIAWGQKRKMFDLHIEDFDPGETSSKPTTPPLWLPGEFFRDLYESQGWYFRGVFAFLTYSLCRGGEAITLKVGDVDLEHNRINLIRHKTGDLDDRLPMVKELQDEMFRYLHEYRKAIGGQLSPDMYLFPRYRVYGQGLTQTVYPHEQRASLSWTCHEKIVAALPEHDRNNPQRLKGIGSHSIRRAMARYMYDRLVRKYKESDALRQVQGMLGHGDVTITQRYIGMSSVRESRDRAIDNMTFFDEPGEVVQLRATAS